MNAEDVKNYLTEDPEGQALLEDLKKPLLQKRDELLAELAKSNGKAGEVLQRSAESERLLNEERASIRKLVLTDQLDKLLKGASVPDLLRPNVTASLLAANDGIVEANGLERMGFIRTKDSEGKETQVDLQTFVNTWAQSDEGKQIIPQPMVPAGLGGRVKNHGGGSLPLSTFDSLSPEERMAHTRAGGTIE